MTDTDTREYYTPKQLAELLSLNRGTIYEWIRNGHIDAYRVGSHLRISRAALDAFLAVRVYR